MKLSIVTTLYNSQNYVNEFYQRILSEAEKITDKFEIIFVDDGSPDSSLDKSVKLSNNDERVKVVELSKNFGHHKAMMTGLLHAKGELVFLIDSDLEEPPELLGYFKDVLDKSDEDLDVVYGVQRKRRGSWFGQITGNTFYKLLNKLTDLNLAENLVTARLMNKNYVNALVLHEEREVFMAGLWEITGFNQKSVIVDKLTASETTYSLTHKLKMLETSITSFSQKPLKIIFHTGATISILAFLFIFYLILQRIFSSAPLEGWTTIVASIWLVGGLIIFFIGVIGIYLSKVFIESKRRPYTIVRNVHERT